MTETPTLPAPDAADRKPRAADKPVVTDAEAPFGWMKDPVTGETRPRKRPGKQAKSAPPPRQRPANKTRSTPAQLGKGSTQKHAEAVAGLTESVWLLLAAIPPVDYVVPGTRLSIRTVSTRARAQAALIEDNQQGLVQGVTMIADHSGPVSRALLKANSDDSPIWVLPAMLALMPFVVQSAAMYGAPVDGSVELLAARTGDKFSAMLGTAIAEAEGSGVNGHAGGTTVHGAEAHPDQAF